MISALVSGGVIFGLAAVYIIINGFMVPIVVTDMGASTYLPAGMDGIANLHAMHIQMADFVLGIGGAIVSAVFFGAAAIVKALEDKPPGD